MAPLCRLWCVNETVHSADVVKSTRTNDVWENTDDTLLCGTARLGLSPVALAVLCGQGAGGTSCASRGRTVQRGVRLSGVVMHPSLSCRGIVRCEGFWGVCCGCCCACSCGLGDGRRGRGPWAQACCSPAHALGACRRVHCRQQTEASYCSLLLRFFCIPLGREVAARHRDAGTGRTAGSANMNPLWYGLLPCNPSQTGWDSSRQELVFLHRTPGGGRT